MVILRFKRAVDKLLKAFLMLSIFLIFFLVTILVFMRYVFSSTLVGANEMISILFVYTTVIGAAVAIGEREHITVRFVVDKLPPAYRKTLDSLTLILIASINAAMVWYSLSSWIPITGKFLMPALQLPQIYAQISVPIGGSLAVLYCLFALFDAAESENPQGWIG